MSENSLLSIEGFLLAKLPVRGLYRGEPRGAVVMQLTVVRLTLLGARSDHDMQG